MFSRLLQWCREDPIRTTIFSATLAGTILATILALYTLIQVQRSALPVALPSFSWPPPRASEMMVTVPAWLKGCTTLNEAYLHIRNGMQNTEYLRVGIGLYAVEPEGFLIVTKPQRIQSDGSPDNYQWDITRRERRSDFFEVMGISFDESPEGLYRFFIIAVTPNAPSADPKTTPNWKRDSELTNVGDFLDLPRELREVPLTDAYRMHIYLYHYRREQLERDPHFTKRGIDIDRHLKAAKLGWLIDSNFKGTL